mgnify:CR=1 FL=1
MKVSISGNCNALLTIGDDFGDNDATCRCLLPEGHEGKHLETSRNGELEIRWVKDERLVCPRHGRQDTVDLCHLCQDLHTAWEKELAAGDWDKYIVPKECWENSTPALVLEEAKKIDNGVLLKHPKHGWFLCIRCDWGPVILGFPEDFEEPLPIQVVTSAGTQFALNFAQAACAQALPVIFCTPESWESVSQSSPRRGALPDVLALIEMVESLQGGNQRLNDLLRDTETQLRDAVQQLEKLPGVFAPAPSKPRCVSCQGEIAEPGLCVVCRDLMSVSVGPVFPTV